MLNLAETAFSQMQQLTSKILQDIFNNNFVTFPTDIYYSKELTCFQRFKSMDVAIPDAYFIAQVVHIRKLSKKIMFLDARVSDISFPFIQSDPSTLGSSDPHFEEKQDLFSSFGQKIEVLYRWDEISEDLMRESRYHIKVFDVIQIRGFLERTSYIFHALETTMVKKRFWAATSETDACYSLKARLNFQPELPQKTDRIISRNESNLHDLLNINLTLAKNDFRDPSKKPSEMCKYWVNNHLCHKGAGCLYYHPTGNEYALSKANWISERKRARALRNLEHEQGIHGVEDAKSEKQKKSYRAYEFSKFLVETYGVSYLKSGKGLLDIAGGRGEVSFELCTKLGLSVTLIDPRPRKLSKLQARYLKKNPDAPLSTHIQEFFKLDDPRWSCQETGEKYSLVIGMHPDQATDLIVDYAINEKIPFAIVPCCVFAREFQHRSLDGLPVTSYPDLLKYLQKKPPASYGLEICCSVLDFQGRNKVLFSKPKID